MKNRITKREEIEMNDKTIKYHFRDKEDILIATVLNNEIINTIEDITDDEIKYIKEIARLE